MHLAASAGHVNAVELLLDLNASFIRNNDDETGFTQAITNQNQEVAMAIIQVFSRHRYIVYTSLPSVESQIVLQTHG